MSIRPLRSALMVFATSATLGCSDPAALEEFIIFITNSWEVVGVENYRFEFVSENDGGTAGDFTGTEFRTAADEGTPLDGSWSSNQISFTVQREGGIVFSGELTADDLNELQLTSSEGSVRIRKQ